MPIVGQGRVVYSTFYTAFRSYHKIITPPIRSLFMKKTSTSRPVLYAVLCLSMMTQLHSATLIHNDGFTINNELLPDKDKYGSNVSANGINWTVTTGAWGVNGTPDIKLSWDGESGGNKGLGLETYTNWDGRGNVIQLDGSGTGGTPNSFISFIPDNVNTGTFINSFYLDAYSGGGTMTADWFIRDATSTGTILASGSWTRSNTGGHDLISPNYASSLGQTLVLQITRTAGDPAYFAMDELRFDQIPEPTSLFLGGFGSLLLLSRRRR